MMLKEILKSKGVKQKWLAETIGVTEVTVSHWVQGKAYPNRSNWEKISKALNVPLKDLINE